jgi:DNA-binding ferritin-like protein (Dps family)
MAKQKKFDIVKIIPDKEIEKLILGATNGRYQTKKQIAEVISWAEHARIAGDLLKNVLSGRLEAFCDKKVIKFVQPNPRKKRRK